MPTASQRLAAASAAVARLFDGGARWLDPRPAPGAPAAYAPGAGLARGVRLPGVTPYYATPKNLAEDVARALLTPDAYLGRVSYDAGPTLARYSSYPATDLSPEKIAGAQQEAAAGWPLRWTEMIEQILSRDAHLSGIGQQRVDDVVKGTWRMVRSAPDDLAAVLACFAEEALRGVDSLDDGLGWLLWGNAYGYASTEVVWRREPRFTFSTPDGKRVGPFEAVVPARLCSVHPKHFRFDLRTDEPLLWLGSSQVSLPFGKFVFCRGEGQHPVTERRGYMWPCAWLSMFKSIGWAGWAAFVDRFGMPTPLVEYEGTLAQYDEYKRAYEDVLNSLGTGKGAIFPRNAISVRGLEFPQGGRASDPHSALSDACDAAQSIRVLGATLTARIGNVGSFAASSQHAEVKYAKEEADARRAWSTIRSDLVAPMTAFNALGLAKALFEAGYSSDSVAPDAMPRRVPRGLPRVPRDLDLGARMKLCVDGINELGLDLDPEPLYDEFNFAKGSRQHRAPGRPVNVTSGGRAVGSVEASDQGADAPKEPDPARAAAADDDEE